MLRDKTNRLAVLPGTTLLRGKPEWDYEPLGRQPSEPDMPVVKKLRGFRLTLLFLWMLGVALVEVAGVISPAWLVEGDVRIGLFLDCNASMCWHRSADTETPTARMLRVVIAVLDIVVVFWLLLIFLVSVGKTMSSSRQVIFFHLPLTVAVPTGAISIMGLYLVAEGSDKVVGWVWSCQTLTSIISTVFGIYLWVSYMKVNQRLEKIARQEEEERLFHHRTNYLR